jgi:Fe-S-cluster containining protein
MSSLEALQAGLQRAAKFLGRADRVGQSEDPRDIYYLIDFMVYLVKEAYPYIPCQSGCSHCCVDSGLPRTSALEWQHIYAYLRDTASPEVRQTVLRQNEVLHRQQLALFLQEQARIERPDTDLPLPAFGCKRCPFLIDDRCSVYPVRPAICRGFGYFTWRPRPQVESQVFACQMAADTLLEGLQLRQQDQAMLPVWNAISDKLYALNAVQGQGVIATLPLWLLAHTGPDGELLPALNLQPDFQGLLHTGA